MRAESEESRGEFNYTRDTKRELKRARQFRQVRAIVKKEDERGWGEGTGRKGEEGTGAARGNDRCELCEKGRARVRGETLRQTSFPDFMLLRDRNNASRRFKAIVRSAL